MFEWSYSSFSFFVVPFYLAKVDGNMYLFSLCTAIAEILSVLICLVVIQYKYNLKRSLIVFCAISFIGTIGIIIFNSIYKGTSQVPQAALYLLLYTGCGMAFDLVYLIVCEMFPTIFRTTAYGCCNVLGRAVTISAPLVAELPGLWPMGILAVYSLLASILPFWLRKVGDKDK